MIAKEALKKMMMGSFYFKQKAREALRGNWQTALVVTFFAGALLTVVSVLQSLWVPDPLVYVSYGAYEQFMAELTAVTQEKWLILAAVGLLALLLSPALAIGCNLYFLRRLENKDSDVREGLTARLPIWGKALWLYVLMGVRIALWSLLFVIPGIIAALRYSMAPYYLAEDPELSAKEALEKSKTAMRNTKTTYFMLLLSFVGWSLLASFVQIILMDLSVVVALVAAQFMQLAVSVYMNASCAAFYRTVCTPEGAKRARGEMREQLRRMGMDESSINAAGFGEEPTDLEDDRPDDGGEAN